MPASRVVAIKERSIPKTTSGKIKREGSRRALHNNMLEIVFEDNPNQSAEERRRFTEDAIVFSDGQGSSDCLENTTACIESPNKGMTVANPEEYDKIVTQVLCSNTFDSQNSWEELGLSSMLSVELKDAIASSFPIILPHDCFEVYPTPVALKTFVLASRGTPLAIKLTELDYIRTVRKCVFPLRDRCLDRLVLLSVKRRGSAQEHINNNSQAPNIASFSV
jgi:acyl carrier protein